MRLNPLSRSAGRAVMATLATACLLAAGVVPANATVGTPAVGLVGYSTNDVVPLLIQRLESSTPIDVAIADTFAVALLADGTLVASTDAMDAEIADLYVAADGHKIVEIEAGYSVMIARLDNGRVVPFGGPGGSDIETQTASATEGHTVVDIVAWDAWAAAITDDGDVLAWGNNGGPASPSTASAIAAGISGNAEQISIGNENVLVLLDDNSVIGFGANQSGGNDQVSADMAILGRDVKQIATLGSQHFALVEGGTIATWGGWTSSAQSQIDALIGENEVVSITNAPGEPGQDSIIANLANGEVVSFSLFSAQNAPFLESIGSNQVSTIIAGHAGQVAIVDKPLVEFSSGGKFLDDVVLAVGDTVQVSGSGIRPNVPYTITLNGLQMAAGSSALDGTITTDLAISPDLEVQLGENEFVLHLREYSFVQAFTLATGLAATKPTIGGAFRVGSTLTAVTGKWSSGTAFTYAWYRSGVAITGAKSATYTLTPSDRTKQIQVRVTGAKTGFASKSLTSAKTAVIGYGRFVAPIPLISGSAHVGTRLVVDRGTWNPATATFTYQWFANGVPIAGATRSAFTVPGTLLDKTLTVQVSASKAGFVSARVSSHETDPMDRGTIEPGSSYIDGEFAPGKKLTVVNQKATAGVVRSYQWYRDGAAIPGATAASFATVTSDLGHEISARITFYKLGHRGIAVSVPGTIIKPALTVGSVAILGVPKVGNQLGASLLLPADATQLTVWVVKSSTGVETVRSFGPPTYTVTAEDKGYRIIAYTMITKEGFAAAYRTSAPSAVVL